MRQSLKEKRKEQALCTGLKIFHLLVFILKRDQESKRLYSLSLVSSPMFLLGELKSGNFTNKKDKISKKVEKLYLSNAVTMGRTWNRTRNDNINQLP